MLSLFDYTNDINFILSSIEKYSRIQALNKIDNKYKFQVHSLFVYKCLHYYRIQGFSFEFSVSSSISSSRTRSKQSQESSYSIRSSLRVNTSLDCVSKSRRKNSTAINILPEGISPKKVTIKENSVLFETTPIEKNGYQRDASGIKSMPDSFNGKSGQLGSISATDKSNSSSLRSRNVVNRSTELRDRSRSAGGVPSIHVRGTGRYKSNANRSQKTPGTDRSSSGSNNSSPAGNKRKSSPAGTNRKSGGVETFQIEESLSESLENMSLVKRLKDCFIKPSTGRKKISPTSRSSRSMNITNGNGESSCIEGTPLPISKSFLWKSQIKQNTFTSHLNFGQTFNASEKKNEIVESVGTNQKGLLKSKELLR